MNERPYVAFYRDKRHELYAESSLQAQRRAAKFFRAKKAWDVTVVLADKPISTGSL